MRLLPLCVLLAATGCATMTSNTVANAAKRPVLLVHGIDDSGRNLLAMANALKDRGWTELERIDLEPNDGALGIAGLAEQVDAHARSLAARSPAGEIDIVGFSMGSLVSRYWLKRMNQHVKVRTFVSISGPHHGTLAGYFRWNEGATQMRPGSPLIRDLERDEGEWGDVAVYSFWTPLDLMIFPAKSSRLKGATERTFPVLAHPLMLFDARVQDAVRDALDGTLARARPFERQPAWP